jgi:hypothetical protein
MDACNSSFTRPLSQKLELNAGGYWFAIVMYAGAALYSGYWLMKYFHLRLAVGNRLDEVVWSKLGLFLLATFLASSSGAVTRAGWMRAAEFRFRAISATSPQEKYLHEREEELVFVYYRIMRAVETPFLNIVYLMVLSRLTNHAYTMKSNEDNLDDTRRDSSFGISRYSKVQLKVLFSAIMVLVSLCSAIGFGSSFASAKYLEDSSELLLKAALTCERNGSDTSSSSLYFQDAEVARKISSYSFFIQSVSDVVSISLITIMFSVIGPVALYTLHLARLFLEGARSKVVGLAHGGNIPDRDSSTPRNAEVSENQLNGFTVLDRGKRMATEMVDSAIRAALGQRNRYIASYLSAFAAFIVRSVFIVFVAIQSEDKNSQCSVCEPCQTLGSLIGRWYILNTWFSGIMFAITTPVAFCVSGNNMPLLLTSHSFPCSSDCCLLVWCMMSNKERRVLRAGEMPSTSDANEGKEMLINRLGLALRPSIDGSMRYESSHLL